METPSNIIHSLQFTTLQVCKKLSQSYAASQQRYSSVSRQ